MMAMDEDKIPASALSFQEIKIKAMPAYQPTRGADGRYVVMSRAQIVEELRQVTGVAFKERGDSPVPPERPRIICRYEFYSEISDAWFKSFYDWYQYELWSLDLTYRQNVWDCDDFSIALNAMADLMLLANKEHPPPQLIGRLVVRLHTRWANVEPGGMHEITIYRSETGWHVMEPQNGISTRLDKYPNRDTIEEILFN